MAAFVIQRGGGRVFEAEGIQPKSYSMIMYTENVERGCAWGFLAQWLSLPQDHEFLESRDFYYIAHGRHFINIYLVNKTLIRQSLICSVLDFLCIKRWRIAYKKVWSNLIFQKLLPQLGGLVAVLREGFLPGQHILTLPLLLFSTLFSFPVGLSFN